MIAYFESCEREIRLAFVGVLTQVFIYSFLQLRELYVERTDLPRFDSTVFEPGFLSRESRS